MNKTQKQNICLWTILGLAYCSFIFLFSFFYPYGGDEYLMTQRHFGDAVTMFLTSYLVRNPRIGLLFNNIILYFGKWSFLVLNPLIQLTLVTSIFYFIWLRLPDFKSRKDIYPFSLIALLSVFAVAVPDNTLFWIGGACNYSWMFLPFMIFICLLRYDFEKGLAIKKNSIFEISMFFLAFIAGMSSENASPMLFIIFFCYFAYSRFKKTEVGQWFIWAFAGLILGLIALFAAPGSYYRLKTLPLEYFKSASLFMKMLWHIPRLGSFFEDSLFIPLITLAGLLASGLLQRKNALKDKDFVFSVAFLAIALVLAMVLFPVPLLLDRVYYGASVCAVISFVFMLKYFSRARIFKSVFLFCFCAAAAATPLLAIPYVELYIQNSARMQIINRAKEKNKKSVFIPPLFPLCGPTQNLSLNYYDFVYLNNCDKETIFGIDVDGGVKPKLLPMPQRDI